MAWTGKAKPTKEAPFNKDIDVVTDNTQALVKLFAAVDKIELNNSSKTLKKDIGVAIKIRDQLKGAIVDYTKLIDNAIKKADKKDYPDAYRELKVLKTHLTFLLDRFNAYINQYSEGQILSEVSINEKIDKASKSNATKTEMDFIIRKSANGWRKMIFDILHKLLRFHCRIHFRGTLAP